MPCQVGPIGWPSSPTTGDALAVDLDRFGDVDLLRPCVRDVVRPERRGHRRHHQREQDPGSRQRPPVSPQAPGRQAPGTGGDGVLRGWAGAPYPSPSLRQNREKSSR